MSLRKHKGHITKEKCDNCPELTFSKEEDWEWLCKKYPHCVREVEKK